MSYAFKVDRGTPTLRPFVVHSDIGGVDLCLDVKVELEIRTRMSHQADCPHVPAKAQVSLHPRIDFEPCGTYLRTNAWLGTRGGLKARQEALHKLHMEIVNAFGGEAKLKSWKNLDDVPRSVTVLGASVEHVREYVNEKLAELGDAAGGGHAGHDGRAGRGRRSRTRTFIMTPVDRSRNRSSVRKKSAKRRGSAARAAHRPRQTSKSKTPSRAR
ncbi:MAG TPA: hypothetical protein VMS76_10405 [Planctomycetota bacterium]|nr:hypothetical protein [Planctomycetota bacterium]